MLLVIPVSKHDKDSIENFKLLIDKFPVGKDHDLLVIGSKENENDIDKLEYDIKHLFNSSKKHIIDDTIYGWPMSCNFYFQQTCAFLKGKKQFDSFFWCELDSFPLKENWLDLISSEYYLDTTKASKEKRTPKIYLGVKERNYEGENGELLPESIAGPKMSSIGVYSMDICNVPVLPSLSITNRHWTSVIQWYTTPLLNDSKLIQNNWRTNKYRNEGDSIVCDSIANLAWDVHFNNPINSEAVIIHGCKDESLVDLLLNNNKLNDMKLAKQISVEDVEEIVDQFEEKQYKRKYKTKKQNNNSSLDEEKDNK
jgi:hypothetical protein